MALTKVSTGMLSADVASIDLNIDANTMYIDVSNNRVGINNAAPSTALDVTGSVTADGLTVDGKASVNQNMTDGSVSAFTDPHLALKSTDSVDTTGFVGISFATSDTTNYGFSLGAQRTSGGQGNLVVRNHFNSAQGTKKLSVADNGDISFYEDTGTTPKFFWDASAESLGIGTSSPTHNLTVGDAAASDYVVALRGGVGGFFGWDDSANTTVLQAPNTRSLSFQVNSDTFSAGTEAMRIDSSGNLLVGTTSTDTAAVGFRYRSSLDAISSVADGGISAYFGRRTSDGDIVAFRKNDTIVGSIASTDGTDLQIGSGNCYLRFDDAEDKILPTNAAGVKRDNIFDFGHTDARFDDIYASNGTIQTSDRNEKQDIAELSDAEQRVAVAAKGLLRKFRWKSAVEEKGDDARIHFGIIAQDLQAAFAAEGLDAGDYAMFINSTWTDEETGEERSRMGVRYSELLAFIIAAI